MAKKVSVYDRRRKYYLILDCETATLPYAENFSGKERQAIAISKPLIYDLGWTVTDKKGRVYARKNFLITEIFSVPSIFNTAYYKDKRCIYLEKLVAGEIVLTDWKTATAELEKDLAEVCGVGAYNAMFDYKKAVPFTELYISHLYAPDFSDWMKAQEKICDRIAAKVRASEGNMEMDIFRFRGKSYPLFDLWGLACKHLLDCDRYREMCIENEWLTASGKFYKTSAETTYRFITGNTDFDEAHTALDDADIETVIFSEIVKAAKNQIEWGIIAFPFRIVGKIA